MENRKRNILVLDLQEVKAHTAQLQKIGVNINQIARRINETACIYTDDMDELTPAILNDMVKAVYVHAPDKSSGHRVLYALSNFLIMFFLMVSEVLRAYFISGGREHEKQQNHPIVRAVEPRRRAARREQFHFASETNA